MSLKPTQIRVLKVLVENKDKYIGKDEIRRQSGVNSNHIDNAVMFFLDNDFIYLPNCDGKIKVTLDGICAYQDSL
ncbi:hypothetical protein [Paraclostridium bifermentans]|uniref:hypothetical protein n=1 Tax=Paraclostridium bifermentans TaxID=1490 RepID=UPI001FF23526|nr:hypothetical protein [Paraclostridium bifermentans]UOW66874.1 hypothetical protein MTR78_09955 [Paraclostridium bifermentans]